MRYFRLLDAPAARFVLAVAVVLVARSVLRQPYVFADTTDPPRPAPSATIGAGPRDALAVPTRAAVRAHYSIELVWNQMYVMFGDRLAQAALRRNAADYLATWQEMGSYLRSHNITTAMFQERMTTLGWPADEQDRLLVAAGFIWPPREPDEPAGRGLR